MYEWAGLLNAIDYSARWGQHDRHAFSRAHSGSLHNSFNSALSIPLHRPTIVLPAVLVIVSHQLCPARWCLPGFPTLSPHVQNILNDLQQRVLPPNVPGNSPMYIARVNKNTRLYIALRNFIIIIILLTKSSSIRTTFRD